MICELSSHTGQTSETSETGVTEGNREGKTDLFFKILNMVLLFILPSRRAACNITDLRLWGLGHITPSYCCTVVWPVGEARLRLVAAPGNYN